LDPRAWLGTATDAGTLDEVTAALGGRARFAGWGTPYVAVDGAHVRCDYRDRRGWKEPGNLLGVTVTVDAPGRASRPEDDDCPTCADLLVRGGSETSEGSGMDVDATVAAVAAALAAGLLTEDVHRVRLADLRPLHASGLMDHVESQLTCTTCRRILCLALRRDGAPTLGHHVLDEARRHPLEPVPPVEQWGDAARIAAAEAAMRYVDHQPGAWFLVEQQGALFLQARYVISSMADDSALVRLDATEVAAYRVGGHDYLSALARRIHDGSPHRPGTPFHDRDLLRGPDGPRLRDEVGAAIANHTWIAEQHRRS
ncbi:MAG TPA: hypothetical protein VGE77_03945, partial [Nocardioides sp.]